MCIRDSIYIMSDANIFKLPTTFKHNHHDHDCSCVKCYVDKLTIIPKVEFVWLIDYFFVLLIDDYKNQLQFKEEIIDLVISEVAKQMGLEVKFKILLSEDSKINESKGVDAAQEVFDVEDIN